MHRKNVEKYKTEKNFDIIDIVINIDDLVNILKKNNYSHY